MQKQKITNEDRKIFTLNPLVRSFSPTKLEHCTHSDPFSPKKFLSHEFSSTSHSSVNSKIVMNSPYQERIMEESENFTNDGFTSSFIKSYQELIDKIELDEETTDTNFDKEPNPLSPKIISIRLDTEVNVELEEDPSDYGVDEKKTDFLSDTPVAFSLETPNISAVTLSNTAEPCFLFINCVEFGAYYFVYALTMRVVLFIVLEPFIHTNEFIEPTSNSTMEHSIPLQNEPELDLTDTQGYQNEEDVTTGNVNLVAGKKELIPPDILLQNLRLKNNERILIGHLNINTIPNKVVLLEDLVHNRVDILLVSETKINKSFPTDQLRMMGFATPLRFDRSIHGGGLILYLRLDNLPASEARPEVPGREPRRGGYARGGRERQAVTFGPDKEPHDIFLQEHLTSFTKSLLHETKNALKEQEPQWAYPGYIKDGTVRVKRYPNDHPTIIRCKDDIPKAIDNQRDDASEH